MKPDKKFYKCPGNVAAIAVLLLAALAVPATVAMTSRTKTQPKPVGKQNEEELSRLTDKLVGLASVEPAAITVEKLADICEAMESAICDVSLDYTLYYPSTVEEHLNIIAETGLIAAVNNPTYKLCVARPSDLNDLNSPGRWLVKVEESMTLTKDGDIWDASTKYCYNGKISKQLDTGSARGTRSDGYILDGVGYSPYSLMVTPIGFSVFRPSIDGDNKSLSDRLKNKDCVRLYNTVQKVDGFNTIRADFLGSEYKTVYMRVYFSIEHGYTPVKYEHMTGARLESPESNRIAFSYTVGSLEKVAEGLWFPSSGYGKSDDTMGSMYDSTSKIVVNQGLTDEHFDIEFPPGTKVRDEIRDTEYIVKPTKEQKEKFEKEKQWVKEHADEIAAMEREGGRIYSAARLRRLDLSKQLYMEDNDREFPQTLDDLKIYFSGKDKEIFSWLLKNTEYLGAGLELDKVDVSRTPIAYDKTLLKKGEGTNVLFVNGAVKFCRPEELGKLGINDSEDAQVE